jgi:hypothetical protein
MTSVGTKFASWPARRAGASLVVNLSFREPIPGCALKHEREQIDDSLWYVV